ncbi:hypothetical protein BBV17_00800 [Cytobacillus oceanisediminis]|uniref:Uncharacterized protein n=1 Tax=Cytobacillus oceanisediminis TaxID=665099 RepID=A0ABX3CWJ0_9BACI|nr:hypothetical protein BBV17_00800 [Cytobacillus oceanisediminis]
MQTLPQDVEVLVCVPLKAGAFRFSNALQLQRLPPRGHKPILPKRQRTPFREAGLVLVGGGQGASAFLMLSSSRRHRLEVISQSVQKVKEQPFNRLVLCLSPISGRLPLFC